MRALFLVLLLAVSSGCQTTSAKPLDRTVVVTLEDLRLLGYAIPPEFDPLEKLGRRQWFDGALEVEYEFETPDTFEPPFFLYTLAERLPSSLDARMSYRAGVAGTWLGSLGAEPETVPGWLPLGVEARTRLYRVDSQVYAVEFHAWQDDRVLMVLAAGPLFEDEEAWKQVISHKFSALAELPR